METLKVGEVTYYTRMGRTAFGRELFGLENTLRWKFITCNATLTDGLKLVSLIIFHDLINIVLNGVVVYQLPFIIELWVPWVGWLLLQWLNQETYDSVGLWLSHPPLHTLCRFAFTALLFIVHLPFIAHLFGVILCVIEGFSQRKTARKGYMMR